MDPFDHRTLAFVTYELNTGKIVGAISFSVEESSVSPGGEPGLITAVPTPDWMAPYRVDPETGVLLAPNENSINITDDPHRDALFESFMCAGEGELPWKVDPWAARLVPA
jgi:hypothetical protein